MTSSQWRQTLSARMETLRDEVLQLGPHSKDYAESLNRSKTFDIQPCSYRTYDISFRKRRFP